MLLSSWKILYYVLKMPNIFEQSPDEIIGSETYGTINSEIVILSSLKLFLILLAFFKFDHAQVIVCFINIFHVWPRTPRSWLIRGNEVRKLEILDGLSMAEYTCAQKSLKVYSDESFVSEDEQMIWVFDVLQICFIQQKLIKAEDV